MISTRDIDISLGQIVTWNGAEATIRVIEPFHVVLDLGKTVERVFVEDLLNQNEDIPTMED